MNISLIIFTELVPFLVIMAALWVAVILSVLLNAGAERMFPWLQGRRGEGRVVRFDTTLARDGKYLDVVAWVRFDAGKVARIYVLNEHGREVHLDYNERAAVEAEARTKL